VAAGERVVCGFFCDLEKGEQLKISCLSLYAQCAQIKRINVKKTVPKKQVKTTEIY